MTRKTSSMMTLKSKWVVKGIALVWSSCHMGAKQQLHPFTYEFPQSVSPAVITSIHTSTTLVTTLNLSTWGF